MNSLKQVQVQAQVLALSIAVFLLLSSTTTSYGPVVSVVSFTITTTSISKQLHKQTLLPTTRLRIGFLDHTQQQKQQKQKRIWGRNHVLFATTDSDSDSGIVEENSNSNMYDCIVLGGGISGCTLAHNLYRQGLDNILLTEVRNYLGGNVKSHVTNDGYIWEEGPNSFATQPSIVRIAHELNIDDQLVFANEALPPWVNHNGQLHPLPKGMGGKGPKGQLELLFGPNGIFQFVFNGSLLSWPGKIRAGIGAFLGHLSPPSSSDNSTEEETIQQWITRILGTEVFERCIDPFVSGVYAGNPATLSMKAALPKIARIEDISYGIVWNKFGAIFYGGLLRQIELTKERKANPPNPDWVEFEYGNPGSFRYGLSTLPNAISKELGQPIDSSKTTKDSKVRLEWKIIKVEQKQSNDDDGSIYYTATFDTPTGIQVVQTKSIVSTIPAHALQGIFTTVLPEVDEICLYERKEIQRIGIYYPPVAAVTVAYPKSSFRDIELPNGFGNLQNLPGFGSLNPRSEGVRTLGTLWSSSLFPNRAPDDYNLLLNYIGGSRDISIGSMSQDEIIKHVDTGCRTVLLQPNAPQPKVLGIKVWPTAIPQYELGHGSLLDKLQQAEVNKSPGLWICGNFRTGVAFPDCVTFGYDHSKIVLNYLNQQQQEKQTPSTSSPQAATTTSSSDAATVSVTEPATVS